MSMGYQSKIKEVAVEIANTLPGLGEEVRRDATAVGLAFGNWLSEGMPSQELLNELVGLQIEETFLWQLQEDAHPEYLVVSVADARGSLLERLDEIGTRLGRINPSNLSDGDMLQLMDRLNVQGEEAAPDEVIPEWHGEVLAEREKRLASGQEAVLDWEDAKAQLRREIDEGKDT